MEHWDDIDKYKHSINVLNRMNDELLDAIGRLLDIAEDVSVNEYPECINNKLETIQEIRALYKKYSDT